MIPGYKSVFKTAPPASVAIVASVGTKDSNNSRHSKGTEINTVDLDGILERSAIQEYDAGMSRTEANMSASRAYDGQRPWEPEATVREAIAAFHGYIGRWQPRFDGDLPDVPPNVFDPHRELWASWWRKVEGACHE